MKFSIHLLEETASTNDDVRQAAESGAAAGLVIRALKQSAGRGRHGRAWQSPEGNLYFSALLRPPLPLRDFGLYSFAAALAVGDALAALLPQARVELKWPNDVLVNGQKISGILLEAGEGYLIAGIGVNIGHSPENPFFPATSLAANGARPAPERVLDAILAALGVWCERLEKEGFAPLRAAWLERARQGPMRVRLPHEEISGTFAGLGETGDLRLILPDGGEKTIRCGDVFF